MTNVYIYLQLASTKQFHPVRPSVKYHSKFQTLKRKFDDLYTVKCIYE